MRLFIAIDVPRDIEDYLAELQKNIQGKGVQASQSWTLKAGAYLKITKTS